MHCLPKIILKRYSKSCERRKQFKTVIKDVSYIHIKIIFIIIIKECNHTLLQACHHYLENRLWLPAVIGPYRHNY